MKIEKSGTIIPLNSQLLFVVSVDSNYKNKARSFFYIRCLLWIVILKSGATCRNVTARATVVTTQNSAQRLELQAKLHVVPMQLFGEREMETFEVDGSDGQETALKRESPASVERAEIVERYRNSTVRQDSLLLDRKLLPPVQVNGDFDETDCSDRQCDQYGFFIKCVEVCRNEKHSTAYPAVRANVQRCHHRQNCIVSARRSRRAIGTNGKVIC